jgi:hypothetical protein
MPVIVATPARALEFGGALITEFIDRQGSQGGSGLIANHEHGQFRLTQFSLNLAHDLSKFNRLGATLSTSGANITVNEAWMRFSGVPYDGAVTVGRFYKPLGAPLMNVGLSYPALLFHSAPVTGMKVDMNYYPWRWEVGFVNQNAFSERGSVISGSIAFGRPAQNLVTTHRKEGYVFLGWRDGGGWGSLDLNATYSIGEFIPADQTILNGLGIVTQPRNERTRNLLDLAADYTYGPVRIYGEYAVANEGKLNLRAWNVNGSYRIDKYLLTIGYDKLDNNAVNRLFATPASWERKRVSYGVTWEYRPQLKFDLFYENNKEFLTNWTQDLRNNAVIFQTTALF